VKGSESAFEKEKGVVAFEKDARALETGRGQHACSDRDCVFALEKGLQ